MTRPSPTPEELALIDPDGAFRRRLAVDREALGRLLAADPSPDAQARLEVLVHRLAGAAGTFAYAEVSDVAIALDDAFVAARHGAGAVPDAAPLLAALDRALEVSLKSA